MDTKPKLNLSALNGTSVPSRPPSPRMAPPVSARAPVREQQRGLSPRPGTHSVVATAAKKFVNAPLPASLRPAAALQESSALASDISEDSTSWTGEAALRTLIQTKHLTRTALADFLRDPLAWLVRFTRQLQAILLQLLQPKGNSCATSAAAAAKEAAAAATTTTTTTLPAAPLTNRTTPLSARGRTVASPISQRGSSGRYVAPASPRQQRAAKAASPAPTILLAAQQTIANVAQRPVVPVAAFALSAAAAVVLSGCWLLRRWRAAAEAQREMQQRAAAKRDVLARQKQRFQRALVVDSVNLELPPIKDKDVQPGPVRVGQILQHKQPSQQQQQQGGRMGSAGGEQQSKQQRGGSNGSGAGQVPGLAGESLRQWQQFMMASRAEEVTNVSGKNARGGRSSAQQDSAASRPFKTMDDRTLSDLSERIRRANESGAAGVAPVITFEQLYANNKETDDEAMARRAAERKARWQKQQPGVNGHAAAPQPKPQPQPPAERKAPTAAPPASRNRAIKTTIPPDNPFAVGLFDNTPPVAAAAAAGSGPSAAGTRDPSSRPSSSGSSSSTTNVSHPGISTHSQDRSPMQKAPLRADAGSSSSTTSSGASITLSATGTWSTARRALPEFSSASSAPAGSPARRSVAAAASTLLETTSSTGSTSSSINCTALSRKPAARPSTPMPLLNKDTTGSPGRGGSGSSAVSVIEAVSVMAAASSPGGSAGKRGAAVSGGAPGYPAGPIAVIDIEPASPSQSRSRRLVGEGAPAPAAVARVLEQQQQKLVPVGVEQAATTPGRGKRAPACGQLRTPETAAPALQRLMRRPGVAGDAGRVAVVEPELQQCGSPK